MSGISSGFQGFNQWTKALPTSLKQVTTRASASNIKTYASGTKPENSGSANQNEPNEEQPETTTN